MSTSPTQDWTALAEKAKRCFITPFNGSISIYCVKDDRIGVDGENGERPALHIDGNQSPPRITICTDQIDKPDKSQDMITKKIAHCDWFAAENTFHRIFDGGRHLSQAYMSGRLIISGDMAVMARLQIEDVRGFRSGT